MNGYHVRVTKNENGTIKREMMDGDFKLRDISKTEIIALIQQAASTLRYD